MMKRRLLSYWLSLGFLAGLVLNGGQVFAEADAPGPDVSALETAAMDPLILERMQYGIDVVRETATAEEIRVLDVLQAELDAVRSGQPLDPGEQSRVGRMASKAGIAVNRGALAVYRPFVFATAYLVGRFEKPKRLDTQSRNPLRNALGRIVNRLRDIGESVAAEIGERAIRGEPLSRAEIELLVGRFPALEPRDWEFIGSMGGMLVGISVTAKVLRFAGIAHLGPVIIAGEVAYVSAVAPCFINDLSKHPNTNPNFLNYCDRLLDDTYTRTMTSRIRGYLRGVKDRNRRH
jgi:hypothetical protein